MTCAMCEAMHKVFARFVKDFCIASAVFSLLFGLLLVGALVLPGGGGFYRSAILVVGAAAFATWAWGSWLLVRIFRMAKQEHE